MISSFCPCAGDHHRKRTVPLSGIAVPAVFLGHGVGRYPRDDLQLDHEMRRGHQEGPVRQHGAVRRYHHVPGHRGQDAKGNHVTRAVHHEDQDDRPARAQILRVDRRIHPGVAVHLPADVDLQDRIRRERAVHRAQEMLLMPCRKEERATQHAPPPTYAYTHHNISSLLLYCVYFYVLNLIY